VFTNGADTMFTRNGIHLGSKIFCYFTFIIVFTILFHLCGRYRYNNPKTKRAHDELHEFVTHRKNVFYKAEHEKCAKDRMKTMMAAKMLVQ